MREISPEDMPGTKVRAGYQTVSRLREGVQSTVYKALGDKVGESFALKIFHAWLMDNPEVVQAIENEINVLKQIEHESVARVTDSGRTEEGQIYIAFEFVTGPDISRLIAQKVHLSVKQVIDMMIQAAQGLEAALNQGEIHGDLKPSTMIVDSKTRQLRLIDFGFASSLYFPQPDEPPWQTGQPPLVGSCGYLAPEQAMGRDIDFRTDMFSLGATFYHLLARQPIFDTSSDGEYLRLVTNSAPLSLSEVNPDIPSRVDGIIMRLLSQRPNERYEDYESLIVALDDVRADIEQQHEMAKERETSQAQAEADAMEKRHRTTQAILAGGDLPDPEELDDAPTAVKDEVTPEPQAPAASVSAGGGAGINVDISQVEREVERRRGVFHPVLIILAVVILILAILGIFVGGGNTRRSSSGEGGVFAGIKNLFTPSSAKEVDPELEIQIENYNAMLTIQDAVQTYRSMTGSFPTSIGRLEDQDLIEAVDVLDAWGNEMILMNRSNQILSIGPDGEEMTADDWHMPYNGPVKSPPPKLAEYLYQQQESTD
ncbi:MAG: serine/threonine protein kinase [Candidatus Sumerlaeota bacterium]